MFSVFDGGLMFIGGVFLGFCFMLWRFAPENVQKNYLHVSFPVLGSFSLFLAFRRPRFVI